MPNPHNNFFSKRSHEMTVGNEFCHQMTTFFDLNRNLLKNSLKPDFKGNEKVQIGCSGLTTDRLRTPTKTTHFFFLKGKLHTCNYVNNSKNN